MAQKKHQKALAAHFRAHTDTTLAALAPVAGDERNKLSAQARVAVGALRDAPAKDAVPDDELPDVLREPPWEKQRPRPPAPVALTSIAIATALAWEDEEEDEWRARGGPAETRCMWQGCPANGKPYTEHTDADWATKIPKYVEFAGWIYPHYLAHGAREAV